MKKPKGICKICGNHEVLTFEHAPPKSAFNNRRVISARFEEVVNLGPDEIAKGEIRQKGMGAYSLCESCNTITGAWYGGRFVAWCYQAMEILIKSKGKPLLFYPNYVFPLAVIKQIVTMFFTVNHLGFNRANPELVKFVLNRDRKYLPRKYRVFIYYNIKGGFRSTGIVIRGEAVGNDLFAKKPIILSEMNYPPFGYVMSYDGSIPDKRLIEITHFANYDYDEFKIMNLRLPVLPTHLWIPTDYRTKEEIIRDYKESIKKYPPH